MAMVKRTAEITWEGDVQKGSGVLNLATSGAGGELPISLPTRAGESNGQTSPEELIAGSHAGCYAMALSNVLTQAGNPPSELKVSATVGLEREGAGFKLSESRLTARGSVDGVDESQFADFAKQAEQACPVSNAIRGNVEIELDAALA